MRSSDQFSEGGVVSNRWRLGVVERSVLETMDQLGLRPEGPHRKCATIVHHVAEEFGVSRRYGYEALCAMAQPWNLHLPLVDFHGNLGSADTDERPAPPRMTEARISRAGIAALGAERGTGPLVPLALINGDLHVDGYAPPYSPTRVIATLLALIDNRSMSDKEIVERIGPPSSPTGCSVTCDHVALAAGAAVTMEQTATMSYEKRDTAQVVVLSNLPLGIGEWTVRAALGAKVEAMSRGDPDWEPYDYYSTAWETRGDDDLIPPEIDADPRAIPLADVRFESHGQVARIVCYPLPNAAPGDYAPLIASTWGVRTERRVRLAAPLPQLIRELVDDDAEAQRAALAQLGG